MEARTPESRTIRRVFLIAAVFSVTIGVQAQITTHTALPVSAGGGIFRIQTKVLRSGDDRSEQDRKQTIVVIPMVAVYGLTPRLAAFGIVSLLKKRIELNGLQGRITRKNSGLADSQFFLRYTIVQKDVRGATFRIAPFVGTHVPTGSKDAFDDRGVLPRPLQLGSGSMSPFLGTVMTRQTLLWQIDASVSYRFYHENDGFRFGDEVRLDLASKIRLIPRVLGGGVPGFLYLNFESNTIWLGENEIDDIVDTDSGGTTWYLDPGVQYITRRFVFETTFQLPILQNLNGLALKNDFMFVASIRVAY